MAYNKKQTTLDKSAHLHKRLPKTTPVKIKRHMRIGEREVRILLSLDRYRYLFAAQLLTILTTHFKTANSKYLLRRLQMMFHKPYRLINRTTLAVEWGKGSSPFVYTIATKGITTLIEKGYTPTTTPLSASKRKSATTEYKKHEIGVNDVRIASERGARELGWTLEKEITDFEFQHKDMRRFMRVYDRQRSYYIPIVPDDFLAFKRPNGRMAFFFIEFVRKGSALDNYQWHKIRGYFLFRNIWRDLKPFKEFKDADTSFRILTVADSGTLRTFNLKMKAEQEFISTVKMESEAEKAEWIKKIKRYAFVELKKIKQGNIFTSPIWLQPFTSPTADVRYPLFDQP